LLIEEIVPYRFVSMRDLSKAVTRIGATATISVEEAKDPGATWIEEVIFYSLGSSRVAEEVIASLRTYPRGTVASGAIVCYARRECGEGQNSVAGDCVRIFCVFAHPGSAKCGDNWSRCLIA
jgi:hypothetical protein